jgi:hypothetical protein
MLTDQPPIPDESDVSINEEHIEQQYSIMRRSEISTSHLEEGSSQIMQPSAHKKAGRGYLEKK